jgi:hypothetical protein
VLFVVLQIVGGNNNVGRVPFGGCRVRGSNLGETWRGQKESVEFALASRPCSNPGVTAESRTSARVETFGELDNTRPTEL